MGAYCDPQALRGKWVYDDAGSVAKNVVVNGQVPWKDAFTRDFWGTPMTEPQSHKSFRPITTLTFKLNWLLADHLEIHETDDWTLHFHIVNVLLHGICTLLVTESAAFVFDDAAVLNGTPDGDVLAQLITGFLFGLHPVHAESVSNITSRGEMLMSLFFLLAFVSYASHLPQVQQPKADNNEQPVSLGFLATIQRFVCVYLIPWICMAASLFSKEQGATTLMTLVAWDFLKHHGSVKHYISKLVQSDWDAIYFAGRTIVLANQTLILVGFRHWLNGETSPDFIYDQNPAGFSEERFTRVFSTSWVYCLYIRDAIYPNYLAPDWSGRSIILIDDISDPRALLVIMLWIFAFACAQSLFVGLPSHATVLEHEVRRVLLMAFFAFLFLPFLLSSHLLVVAGFMKADRVMYLPLFGLCIMEALLVKTLWFTSSSISIINSKETTTDTTTTTTTANDPPNNGEKKSSESETTTTTTTTTTIKATNKEQGGGTTKLQVHFVGHILVLIQLALFCVKTHERNIAWSSPELLWTKAFNVNPRSHHTMYNCGYELSLRQRFEEAEAVMRPIGNARVDGPSNTFVYAMVLFNLGRCDEAHQYIDIAMDVLEEQREEGGVRHQASALDRTKSNLLVARGYCTTDDFQEQGRVLQEAVRTDPRNNYAVEQFQGYLKKLEQIREMKEKYGMDVQI